ncbi:MAG: NAD(P)-dependent dehydrogenase (short-subunit alcohol dehydrogenase family) [Myxococcota bacterium]|jgi:NAD(P)-dependent dehydrogenase (short-subunit alcohol dehydrogenase family)
MQLENRHVVITGGTGALGRAVVARLARAGAQCHIPNYDAAELGDFDTEQANVHITTGIDLTDEQSVVRYYGDLPAVWASVQLVGGFAMAPLLETTLADFDRMWRMNVATAFLCTREAVRRIRETGAGGRIVNTAARPALTPTAGMIAYATTKAAVGALTQHVAAETRDEPQPILVNAIAPSLFDTPANRAAMPTADHSAWPTPDQIADMVAYLVSAQNVLTSGAIVPVYGRQ